MSTESQIGFEIEESGRRSHEATETRGALGRCCDQMTEAVEGSPASAVLIAFGAGIGLGLLAAMTLSQPAPSRGFNRATAENLGRRILDSISSAIPDPISSRLHM